MAMNTALSEAFYEKFNIKPYFHSFCIRCWSVSKG